MATEKVIVFNADRCTGCRICELVCSMSNQGEYNPNKSFIRLMANEETGVYIPVLDTQCNFCGKCVQWCEPQALSIVELGDAIMARKGATIGSFPIPVYSIAGT